MLVSVPFVLLLLDFWPLNRFQPRPNSCNTFLGNLYYSSLGLVREKIPFFLLAFATGVITFLSQHSGGAVVRLETEGLFSRLATTVMGYFGYLENFLWPSNLSVLYLRPSVALAAAAIGGGLVLVSLSGLALYPLLRALGSPKLIVSNSPAVAPAPQSQLANRKWAITVGWLWFVIMLLPVCGLVQVGPQLMADRYTYLPAIGLALILAWSIPEAAKPLTSYVLRFTPYASRFKFRAITLQRCNAVTLVLAAFLLLAGCALVTRHQLAYWQNTETLMTRALTLDPENYIAHQDLAIYYSKAGKTDLARAHRQRVRELDPSLSANHQELPSKNSPN